MCPLAGTPESLKRDKERGPKIAIEGRSEERLAEPPGEVLDELPRDAAGP
jgi:hypothetical protein